MQSNSNWQILLENLYPSHTPRTKGLLSWVIICSMRGFTVLPATPFTLLYKAFILIYWLWSFKNNCIWKKSAGKRKSRVFWITCSPWPGTAFPKASLLCLWYQFFPGILHYPIVLHYKCSITQGRHVISHVWLPFLHGKRWSLASKAIHHSPFLSLHQKASQHHSFHVTLEWPLQSHRPTAPTVRFRGKGAPGPYPEGQGDTGTQYHSLSSTERPRYSHCQDEYISIRWVLHEAV